MEVSSAAGDTKPPPNLILLLTDQQRFPMHWPEDPAWLEKLTPGDAEIARTGVSFSEACVATCMCSPSRASLFTSRWPAEHGVELTLTRGGFTPNLKNAGTTFKEVFASARRGEQTFRKGLSMMLKGAARKRDGGKGERDLDPGMPNMARVLERAGYTTYLKGKWHLSQPVTGGEWSDADRDHLADAYGFHDWQPPDAGENIEPSQFGGGTASGATGLGYDEDFARSVEAFLADPPPEPWALVVSLVNPHDVLGYPDTWEQGGYNREDWQDLDDIELPPSFDENVSSKPSVHAFMKMGQNSFLGAFDSDEEKLDYCRFYAHLHRLSDEKIRRVLDALGDPDDPESMRSKTVIVRTSDHGELGMSHGGLRQKAFNAYEETLNVPFIVSNPVLFPEGGTSEAHVSLVDIMPTMASLAGVSTAEDGVRGHDLTPVLARHQSADPKALAKSPVDFSAVASNGKPVDSVQDFTHFTYDDHQSGSAFTNVAPPPNRIRALRSKESTYAVYLDAENVEHPEYELYDNLRDPDQVDNLVDRDTGRVKDPRDQELRDRMHAALLEKMAETGTDRTVPKIPA